MHNPICHPVAIGIIDPCLMQLTLFHYFWTVPLRQTHDVIVTGLVKIIANVDLKQYLVVPEQTNTLLSTTSLPGCQPACQQCGTS
eukprot:scaffold89179_cov53-Attheya_sp.AAC.1